MTDFRNYILENGLRILVNEDLSTPLVAMNIIYDVGSRDEDPRMTGMAHLFEHLMFGGSPNVPDFDTPLQMAGAENNAFTTNDFTNYYLTIPANNLETAFWLESDRMLSLNFSPEVLDVQKKVVIEEFNQRYLNQPYGDAMLLFRPLAYKVHPYLWPVIGKDISHIENVTLTEVKNFFFSHYAPNNAILSVSGNVKSEEVLRLAEKWFGPIKYRTIPRKELTPEPEQNEKRILNVERNVPADVLYLAWHVCPRHDRNFYTLDVLTDILAGGESGRLYSSLVRDKKLFSDINAYLTGDIDPGLLIITAKLMEGVSFETAEVAIDGIVQEMKNTAVPGEEIEKVRNKYEASQVFSNTNVQTKAMNLGFCELLGDASLVNKEIQLFNSVDPGEVREAARHYLSQENCSALIYRSIKTGRKE